MQAGIIGVGVIATLWGGFLYDTALRSDDVAANRNVARAVFGVYAMLGGLLMIVLPLAR